MVVSRWPEAINRAFVDTFPDNQLSDDEVDVFLQHWRDFKQETLIQVLKEREGVDRVFAIFILGYLAPAEIAPILLPFLHSSQHMERWASAITFGRLKDERVLSALQNMPLEGIFDFGPVLEQAEEQEVFAWYNFHRCSIASIFGNWGDPQLVPVLRQALHTCWQLEQQPGPYAGRWGSIRGQWYELQDRLAYALGQLGAWGALLDLGLSADRLRIALIYLIIGSLQLHTTVPGIVPAFFISDLAPSALGYADKRTVKRLLAQRFGLSEAEQTALLEQFPYDCERRLLIEIESEKVPGAYGDEE